MGLNPWDRLFKPKLHTGLDRENSVHDFEKKACISLSPISSRTAAPLLAPSPAMAETWVNYCETTSFSSISTRTAPPVLGAPHGLPGRPAAYRGQLRLDAVCCLAAMAGCGWPDASLGGRMLLARCWISFGHLSASTAGRQPTVATALVKYLGLKNENTDAPLHSVPFHEGGLDASQEIRLPQPRCNNRRLVVVFFARPQHKTKESFKKKKHKTKENNCSAAHIYRIQLGTSRKKRNRRIF